MVLQRRTITARSLRKQETPQEVKVWARLRSRQFLGYKFRRQVPIGQYVVDFYCAEKKIIIEIDGGHHMQQQTQQITRGTPRHRPQAMPATWIMSTRC